VQKALKADWMHFSLYRLVHSSLKGNMQGAGRSLWKQPVWMQAGSDLCAAAERKFCGCRGTEKNLGICKIFLVVGACFIASPTVG